MLADRPSPGPRSTAPRGLTGRERQVVEHVAAGLTTQQIAAALAISTHTVVTHVRHVYEKWGVTSRHELRAHWDRMHGDR